MRVSVLQFEPGTDKAANMAQVRSLAAAAAGQHPDIISLPEMWTCLGGGRTEKRQAAEPLPVAGETGGTAYEFLRGLAREHGAAVHGGSMGELAGEQLYNTSLLFGADGRELARYRKIHLFDITTPSGQGFRESALFAAGDRPVTATAANVTFGLTVCYDVRFSELFLQLRRQGAAVIFVPSAFTAETGRDHWEVLLRARAIETQCCIVAAATTGTHHDAAGRPRATWGHSLIIDPWGVVRAAMGQETGHATADLDLTHVARVREAMPVEQHRRLA